MNKVFLTLIAAGAMAGLSASAWSAQGSYAVKLANDPSYPVQMVSVSPQISQDGLNFEGAKVILRNTGGVPCEAFSVSFILTFNNGETARSSSQVDFASLGYKSPGTGSDRRIIPGQVYTEDWTGRMRVPPPEPAVIVGVEARLDYIKMADGRSYGPDPDHIGQQFQFMRWGKILERGRLLDVYKTKGIEALLGELERK